MSEEPRMSSTELKVLIAFDKGEPLEKIAELVGMTVPEVKEILDEAQKKRQKFVSRAERSEATFVYYRPIDATLNEPQKGTMKVGSQILKLLSEGIYSSPANSIKELISNAFDADATTVNISFDGDELVVWDDGKGMDYKDFDEEFVYISRSRKRDIGDYTEKYKRPLIGFIGIGFIAVSELCDMLTITSAKEESDLVFEAKIDFSAARAPEAIGKEFYEVSQFELTNYKKVDKGYNSDAHFSEIRLKNLRPLFKEMLSDRQPFESSRKQIHEVIDYLEKKGAKSVTNLGEYWQFLIELSYISPVAYLKDSPVKGVPEESEEYDILEEIKSTLRVYNFKVTFDGIELRKPLPFPIQRDKVTYGLHYKVHPFRESEVVDGKKLSFLGYIYSQHGNISPKEYNGIIVRIKNVAVGNPDTTLLGYPLKTNLVFRHWVFGEIYVTEGLEESMTIDRSSFKLTHPHYQYLQRYIRNLLDEIVFDYTLNEYYRAKRERKTTEIADNQVKLLTSIIKSEMGRMFDLELSDVDFPVVVDRSRHKVIINQRHSTLRSIPRKFRFSAELLLVLFEMAMAKSEGNIDKLKELFLRSVKEWMKFQSPRHLARYLSTQEAL
ncbi:MAG: ATP-binding protein [Candidatus Bathyarchaeota archaeon]|nr:ATP-binding protein [Candidatus Bathyarchaeota archaeon]